MNDDFLLKVEDLHTYFHLARTHMLAKSETVLAVNGVGFEVKRGKTFGLVGESGCGKSTVALSVLRLVQPHSGVVIFDGMKVLSLGPEELRRLRRRMQLIFQDPYSSLNPRSLAGDIVADPLKIQKVEPSKKIRIARAQEIFRLVGLRPELMSAYPHQLSGGQRQRVAIARALALEPSLIVCDEPVSALDMAIQAQILNLLIRLQRELGLTYLFISHDMAAIQHICDRIAVMYLGRIVEEADRRSLFKQPLHPYTNALLSAVPRVDTENKQSAKRSRLGGDPPSPINPPPGCHFHPRCLYKEEQCCKAVPILKEIIPGHKAACHLLSSLAAPQGAAIGTQG